MAADLRRGWNTSPNRGRPAPSGWILNTLEEPGRTGLEASTGQELSASGARIMGVVNAEERRKIKVNTRRGLQGRVERGLSAGGVPYRYRSERIGEEGQGSQIVVNPAEAAVVRRIFTTFAAGPGLKAIAHEINAEAVPPPRPRAQRGRRPS